MIAFIAGLVRPPRSDRSEDEVRDEAYMLHDLDRGLWVAHFTLREIHRDTCVSSLYERARSGVFFEIPKTLIAGDWGCS